LHVENHSSPDVRLVLLRSDNDSVAGVGAFLGETPAAPTSNDVAHEAVSESLSMYVRRADPADGFRHFQSASFNRLLIAKSGVSP
jgi:hypothetical protein